MFSFKKIDGLLVRSFLPPFIVTFFIAQFVLVMQMLWLYIDEIAHDTGMYCFMVDDTLKALELGAVEDLIIWDNLEVTRYVLRNQSTSEESVVHLTKEQEDCDDYFRDKETGAELETVERETLVEWMANNYKTFGCNLEFVTDRSGEGVQFVKGFGGIGGILRWKVDFVELSNFETQGETKGNESDSDSDSDDGYGFEDDGFDF